jgi:hypothetical protein
MRPLLQNRTPAQLLRIIAASNLLVAAGFGLMAYPPWHLFKVQRSLPLFLLPIGIFVLGLISDLLTKQTLKDGVATDYWPDRLLAGPRKLIDPPMFYILSGVFGGAFLICIAYSYHSHYSNHHPTGAFWAFWYPAMSLIHVRSALRPKPPSSMDNLIRLGPI